MGRALALGRAARGDHVFAIGSNAGKGERLLADASAATAAGTIEFIRADLSTVAGTRAAIATITASTPMIDALALFANRQLRDASRPPRDSSDVRDLLSQPAPAQSCAHTGSVGKRHSGGRQRCRCRDHQGSIQWEDLQLIGRYSMIRAQLQAGRANDLLGVGYAAEHGRDVPYVLYHPGFTRSGDLSVLSAPLRTAIRIGARLTARPIEASVAPIHDFIDNPPTTPLTAIDRGTPVSLTLPTLDPTDAVRLAEATAALIERLDSVRKQSDALEG